MNTTLVLVRHGQSVWNKKNIFTGWTDVGLSATGKKEALAAGQAIKKAELHFDQAYTSVLSRAIKTLWLILEESKQMYVPVINAWQLNERHYGGLTGLNKTEVLKKNGAEQFQLWRRSFDAKPPRITKIIHQDLIKDPRYIALKASELPFTESLKDTCARAWPYWQKHIEPRVKKGEKIIISAHGNSLRGLIKHLEHISDKDIVGLEIPTGVPIVYHLTTKFGKLKIIEKKLLS